MKLEHIKVEHIWGGGVLHSRSADVDLLDLEAFSESV
jgi:hypothetical protein